MFVIKKVQIIEGEPEFVKGYHKETSNIQDICDEYAKIDFASQELHIEHFGAKQSLMLKFRLSESGSVCVRVYSQNRYFNTYRGKKKMSEVSNLYDFLCVLYAEQKIGGIETFKFLLDLTDTY